MKPSPKDGFFISHTQKKNAAVDPAAYRIFTNISMYKERLTKNLLIIVHHLAQ